MGLRLRHGARHALADAQRRGGVGLLEPAVRPRRRTEPRRQLRRLAGLFATPGHVPGRVPGRVLVCAPRRPALVARLPRRLRQLSLRFSWALPSSVAAARPSAALFSCGVELDLCTRVVSLNLTIKPETLFGARGSGRGFVNLFLTVILATLFPRELDADCQVPACYSHA